MPFTYLAHQIVVLPLKNWRPRWFSGTALAIGSMVPDLEYLRDASHLPTRLGHSLKGQFTYCLPITLGLFFITTELVVRPLARRLPRGGKWNLDEFALVSLPIRSLRDFARVVLSALIGSFSHMVLDGFTHHHMWPARALYPDASLTLLGHAMPLALLFQYVASIIGAWVGLYWAFRMLQSRAFRRWSATDAPTDERRSGLWLIALVSLLLGVIAAFGSQPWLAYPQRYFMHAKFYVIGFLVYRITSAIVLGTALSAIAMGAYDRLRAAWAARKTASTPAP